MSDTRKDIIQKAINLFNDKGFFNVSVKDIADAMQISPGNLTYHFNRKEQLLAAVQIQMLEEAEDFIISDGDPTLLHFQQLLFNFYQVQQRYRFYFNDMLYITRQFPEIGERYRKVTLKRFAESRVLVDYYMATGRLKPESEAINYDYVIQTLWAVNTFWTAQKIVIGKNDVLDSPEEPVQLMWSILLPYLTDKGYHEYQEILTRQHDKKKRF